MSDISNEKILALRNIILDQANQQRESLVADARKEANQWLSEEIEKLERETNVVLKDAKARAEDIRRRQVLSAEKEKTTEALKQQNMLLGEALKKFQDGLGHLRERPDYADILTGLALEAARNFEGEAGGTKTLRLKLAALDAPLGPKIAEAVSVRDLRLKMTFDHEPAPIIGGCWVTSEDGRRQINSDWQSRTQEMADVIAERLLPLL